MAVLLAECANPVSPTGGPKDTTPPGLTKAEPPLLTTNFSEERVRIWFDEFVELKELNQQLIISPPMDEKPEIRIKGKSVVIEFQEELKENTTYNIFFGDAIVDLTENNPVSNFQYVFSTGDVLDSLTFRGNVSDAFTFEPSAGLNVMLYINNNDTIPFDSLPFFVKPYYLSKTDEFGHFQFNNLSDKAYKLFVLEDANTNLLFDLITERIAFSDSLIKPYYIPPPPEPDTLISADSLLTDSLQMEVEVRDTIIRVEPIHHDSLLHDPEINDTLAIDDFEPEFEEPDPVSLYMFQEYDSVQKFLKASVINPYKLQFIFKRPALNPEIQAINIDPELNWKLQDINKTRDTLTFWIKENISDSLTFVVSDQGEILDTAEVALTVKERGRKKKDQKERIDKLNVKFGKKTELNKALKLLFNYPVRSYNIVGAMLVENGDTLTPDFHFADSLQLYGEIRHKWLEEAAYNLIIPDSVFFGIGGQSHDTLRFNLQTKALSDYGNLYINTSIIQEGTNHIIQLIQGESVLKETIITENTRLDYEYLIPGDYRLKVIIDSNNNEKWDTGHYILSRQPEKVMFFEEIITIRANWDVEEEWEI